MVMPRRRWCFLQQRVKRAGRMAPRSDTSRVSSVVLSWRMMPVPW
jgi:hypothetical protein